MHKKTLIYQTKVTKVIVQLPPGQTEEVSAEEVSILGMQCSRETSGLLPDEGIEVATQTKSIQTNGKSDRIEPA